MAISKLTYLVNLVLPLVYDDSLSYYEVLCKCAAKLNELITQVNTNTEALEGLLGNIEDIVRGIASDLIAETLTPEYLASIISEDYLDSWLLANSDYVALKGRVTLQGTTINNQGAAITDLQGRTNTLEGKVTAIEAWPGTASEIASPFSARTGFTISGVSAYKDKFAVYCRFTLVVATTANNPLIADITNLPYHSANNIDFGVIVARSALDGEAPAICRVNGEQQALQVAGTARAGTYSVMLTYPLALCNRNV